MAIVDCRLANNQQRATSNQQTKKMAEMTSKMRRTEENYQLMKDDRRSFDIRFWQAQGDRAIFEAVSEMLNDYFLLRGQDADQFRLQRSVESFRKI